MIQKIISGGQTGADRAALDWAITAGVPHGGWCPKGRKAEDGPIPAQYQLMETASGDYPPRTEWNVLGSDGTVIISIAPKLSRGSALTARLAVKHCKPWIHIRANTREPAAALKSFIATNGIGVLNVAGPRASSEPDVAEFVRSVLNEAFGQQ
jgi:Circularly permutated YpsA SLOG family